MSNLPPRLREEAFRRYEPAIQSALATSTTVKVLMKGLADTTIAGRLRDALLSYSLNHWTCSFDSTGIPSLKVYHTDSGVFLGTSPPPKALPVANAEPLSLLPDNRPWSLKDLSALCQLVESQRVQGGVILVPENPSDLLSLELIFNVGFTPQPDGTHILF